MSKVALSLAADTVPEISAAATVPSSILEALIELSAIPDLGNFEIERYELPNILSLNFYVRGILQDGVSSSTRMDPQAKSLGEYLRAKIIQAPKQLL